MLISILILSFLIFFHELGHFVVARFFGVKVEVFSIGFGKKILSWVHKDTTYCISAVPLGGYVQMKGQDDSDPSKKNFDHDSYMSKPPLQKIAILFAGPFANFLLAFFLYIAVGVLGVPTLAPVIGNISENSSAQSAGLIEGDKILEIANISINSWDEIKPMVLKTDGQIELKIERDGKTHLISLTPKLSENRNIFGETIHEKLIGISPIGEVTTLYLTGTKPFIYAYNETIKSATLILKSLQKMVEGVISPKEMGGVISIVQITSSAAKSGIVTLFLLTALISVNLGVINLFPIPALDGGHIIFNLYELLFKRPPNEKVYINLTYAGWAILLILMAFTIINDILRLSGAYQ